MRWLRTILGMLMLTIGLPALLAGAALWTAMQHRDQGGAFSGDLQRLATSGYAFVVPDVDDLLRTDAPFARIGDTQLRINAATQDGPAFVGLAPTSLVQEYLQGVPYATVRTVDIGTGALPVATTSVGGRQAPKVLPARASLWVRSSTDGHLSWSPGDVTGGPYSLVIMSPGAKGGLYLTSSAELRPSWINSSTWGLLTLGTLLAMAGLTVLAWPTRRREIVYVVEPSQVPDLMAAIGAPMPFNREGRPGAHRPRTLADAEKAAALTASYPRFTWPPSGKPALTGPTEAPIAAVPVSAVPSSAVPSAAVPSPGVPSSGIPAAEAQASSVLASAVSASGIPVSPVPVPAGGRPGGPSGPAAGPGRAPAPDAAEYAAATAIPGRVPARTAAPAPGEPLSYIKPTSGGGLPLRDYPTSADPLFGRRGERISRKREPGPGDLPLFQASAVGAWVAETAAERARETEATAAARMAEVARKKAAAAAEKTSKPSNTDQPLDAHPTANRQPADAHAPSDPQPTDARPTSDTQLADAHATSDTQPVDGRANSDTRLAEARATNGAQPADARATGGKAGSGNGGSGDGTAKPAADGNGPKAAPSRHAASDRPEPMRSGDDAAAAAHSGGANRGPSGLPSPIPSGDEAVAAAYAAGAADARAARGAPQRASQPTRENVPASQPSRENVPASQPSRENVPASQPARENVAASQPSRENVAVRDPRTAGQRVSVVTGPGAADWSATGLTRADSPRVGRQQMPSSTPAAAPSPAAAPRVPAPAAASAVPQPARPAPAKANAAPPTGNPTSAVANAASQAAKPAPAVRDSAQPVGKAVGAVAPRESHAGDAIRSAGADVAAEGDRSSPQDRRSAGASSKVSSFPQVVGLGRPSVAAAERGVGDVELGSAAGIGTSGAATVQSGRAGGAAPTPVTDGGPAGQRNAAVPGRSQTEATSAGAAMSSARVTTADAGAVPPLTASGERQAAGAGTEAGRDDRTPVSAPQLNSVIGASGAAPTGAPADRDDPARTAGGDRARVAGDDRARAADGDDRARAADGDDRGRGRHAARDEESELAGERAVAPAQGRSAAPAQSSSPERAPAGSDASDAGDGSDGRQRVGGVDVPAVMHAMARGERIGAEARVSVGSGPGRDEQAENGSMTTQRPMPGPDGPVNGSGDGPKPPEGRRRSRDTDKPAEFPLTQRPMPAAGGVRKPGESGLGGRPAPASWRKAAETVAARAAALAEARGAEVAADVAAEDDEANADVQPAKAARARAAKTAKTAKTAKAAKANAESAKPAKAPAKAATPATKVAKAATKSAATRTTTARTTPAKAAPAKAKPASPTKAAASATGISSYRAEAAELLAAAVQPRRRRTVTNTVKVEPAPPEPVRRRRTPPTG
jgi:hypothetical protein